MKTTVSLASRVSKADLLIVGVYEGEKLDRETTQLEPSASRLVKKAKSCERFLAKHGEAFSSFSEDFAQAPEIVFVGLGKKKNFGKLCLRKVVGRIVQVAKAHKAKKTKVILQSFVGGKVSEDDAVSIFSEVVRLRAYDFNKYKTKVSGKKETESVVDLIVSKKSFLTKANKNISHSEVIAKATLFARDLVNEPANVVDATELVKRARAMAKTSGLVCRVYGKSELEKMKMGGILAVNQGSLIPPALIQLEHGRRHKSKGTICLVGKGVTFDTGGLSIKPAKGMEKMKYDMAGSAAVIGAMKSIADLKLPVHVISLTPAVENNVNNDPTRPGDIIRMYNGKTVEVLNTDAEGRLILADALAYTKTFKPKAIVDLATLTGMCALTFGDECIAIMGNNEQLISKIKKAGGRVGERCWELPMWSEYGKQMKGTQSDLKNIGSGFAGTITAAKFLQEFVPAKTPWVHMDIAGTAWAEAPKYDTPVGATGVGVRLLIELISNWR